MTATTKSLTGNSTWKLQENGNACEAPTHACARKDRKTWQQLPKLNTDENEIIRAATGTRGQQPTDQQNARAHGNHRNGNTCDAQFLNFEVKKMLCSSGVFSRGLKLDQKWKENASHPFGNRCDAQIGSHTPTHISMIIYVSISVYIYMRYICIYIFTSSKLPYIMNAYLWYT